MTDILKACPFCGSTSVTVKSVWKSYRFAACTRCKAGGPVRKDDEQAIDGWNERGGC